MSSWQFRHYAAVLCFAAAILFLTTDSWILARGAMRYALGWWDQVSLAAVAATVPWIIGIMPFLIALTWRPAAACIFRPFIWTGRPTTWTVAILAVWGLFVGYNVFGAGGSIAFTRSDVVSSRKYEASTAKSVSAKTERLQAQLAAIPPQTRSVAALEALMATERARRQWEYSEECKQPTTGAERQFCQRYNVIKAEFGQARERDKLSSQLEEVEAGQRVAGWKAEVSDPTALFWSQLMGWDELTVQRYAPLATPAVLQIGSWVFLSFGLILWGFTGHRDALFGQQRHPHGVAVADESGRGLPAPALAALPSATVEFVKDWFAQHARPSNSGSLDEEKWYAYYSKVCADSGVVPVRLEAFRATAEIHGVKVTEVNGRFYYQRMMPLVAA